MATTENLTILFTDMVGFTKLTSTQTRSQNKSMLNNYDKLLRPLIKQFSGKYIKSIGDAMLVTFRSATNALHCAMAMHNALFEFNKKKSVEQSIIIRAALNTGDIRLDNGDIFGDAVNLAARLESITPAKYIYFTEIVYLSMNRAEVQAEFVGENSFKGVPEKIKIYRIKHQNKDTSKCPFGDMHLNSSHAAQSLRQLSNNAVVEAFQNKKSVWAVLMLGVLAVFLSFAIYSLFFINDKKENVSEKAITQENIIKEIINSVLGKTQSKTPKRNFIAETERLIKENRIEAATQVYRDSLAIDQHSDTTLLLEGHLNFINKKRKKGIIAYSSTLKLDANYSANTQLVSNLIESLGRETKPAQKLLEQYQSKKMIDALSIRTTQPLYWGRQHAISILRNIKQSDRINAEKAALLNYKEAKSCKRKKEAVIWLGKIKSKKALTLLQPIANAGFFNFLPENQRCLVDEAKRSVALIANKQLPKQKRKKIKKKDREYFSEDPY